MTLLVIYGDYRAVVFEAGLICRPQVATVPRREQAIFSSGTSSVVHSFVSQSFRLVQGEYTDDHRQDLRCAYGAARSGATVGHVIRIIKRESSATSGCRMRWFPRSMHGRCWSPARGR